MARVYVGTGYNQVVHFQTNDKTKTRSLYGTLARAPVRSICIDPANDRLLYSTARSIAAAYGSGEVEQVVAIKTADSIVRTEYIHPHAYLRYCLSDGSIHCVPTPALHAEQQPNQDLHPETQFLSQKHSKFTFATSNVDHERYLFCGAGVVPIVENLVTGAVDWYGKNVKNDQLDLEVPMKDIDGAFIGDQRGIAILHADRKLRLYDIRGTQRRPVRDIALKTTDKSQLTRMRIQGEHEYYFSNDIGQIFKCDNRKEWQVVAKFKGITASVTDFQLTKHCLYVASLDSYVHLYDRHTTKLLRKFYVNKPAYSLRVEQEEDEDSAEEVEGEVELQLEEEEDEPKKKEKLKQIRKRNKVGLKYLQPREFDEPTELKMQQVKQKEWYQDLNPTDRRDFEQ